MVAAMQQIAPSEQLSTLVNMPIDAALNLMNSRTKLMQRVQDSRNNTPRKSGMVTNPDGSKTMHITDMAGLRSFLKGKQG
jgi:hypothetical protein